MTTELYEALRGEAFLLAVSIGDVVEAVARVEIRAADLHERIEHLTAMPESDDGESLLRRLRLEEAASIMRDLRAVVLGGGELQTGGVASCARDLCDALDLA